MKKVIFLILCTSFLFSSDSKYLKEKEYSNNDLRVFVGLSGSYAYFDSEKTTDNSLYSYGIYLGLPIFDNYEVILNKYNSVTSDFKYNQQSLTLNVPLTSRKTRRVYVGIVGGKGTIEFNNNLGNLDDYFYGVHIGKRYKFTRNYYARIELEAMKYNYKREDLKEIGKDRALIFNYGFEYRF